MDAISVKNLGDIKALIRQERYKRKWSQSKLADRLGCGSSSVAYIENQTNNKQGLNISTLIPILDVFGLEMTIQPKKT